MVKKQVFPGSMALGKILVVLLAVFCLFPMTAFAESGRTEVIGTLYEFGKDSDYDLQENSSSSTTNASDAYGAFYLEGNISSVGEKSGIPAYEVSDGNLDVFYNYGDTLLNADEDSWHLVEDKSKKMAGLKLDTDILKGAIVVQTSADRRNWVNAETMCNAFSDVPIRTSSIYTTADVQLLNGCYYRVIVAYELRIRTEDSNFLFINTDKHEYKKFAEVYEFYAYTNGGENGAADLSQTYSLGERVRVENFDGYYGEAVIDKDDIHYGWELGNLFVSGYTDEVTDSEGNIVFLKNVGDKVTLWFNLNENINSLNGKDNLSITADSEGYDQYFETPRMNFGRGTLIIRYTDYNNVKAEPVIYTNYLEANVTVGANTKVQLFEEGDYEVALDYEVTSDELIDKVGHYRIFFKFSVRNGNCMVYPFDVATGNELTNSSLTENGFRLDLAKSRYLRINLKREVLKDSADGLVEDTRFNGPAQDGAEYTDEGIYTITVSNEYTGQLTTKKIYVGTNDILRAYVTTGLSIPEINGLVAQGATIADDGTIQLAAVNSSPVTDHESEADSSDPPMNVTANEPSEDVPERSFPVIAVVGGVLVVVAIIIALGISRKRRQTSPISADQIDNDREGGSEQ